MRTSRLVAGSGAMPTQPHCAMRWDRWRIGDRVEAKAWGWREGGSDFRPGTVIDARRVDGLNEWRVRFDHGRESGWLGDAFINPEEA
jgi:hypothetical protein